MAQAHGLRDFISRENSTNNYRMTMIFLNLRDADDHPGCRHYRDKQITFSSQGRPTAHHLISVFVG
jgi:hypothetical protein